MSVQVACPCGNEMSLPERMVGKKVACTRCGQSMTVAARAPEPPPVSESSSMIPVSGTRRGAGQTSSRRAASRRATPPEEAERPRSRRGRGEAGKAKGRPGRRSGGRAAVRASQAEIELAQAPSGKVGLLVAALVACVVIMGGVLAIVLFARRADAPAVADAGDEGKGSNTGHHHDPDARRPRREWTWADLNDAFRGSVVRIETETDTGSGFLVDERGLVLTNFHVVAQAFVDEGIQVKVFEEGGPRIYTDVVPTYLDASTDLAVLEIRDEGAGPFRPVRLDDESRYRTGEEIAAIGSPAAAGAGAVLENSLSGGRIGTSQRRNEHGIEHIQLDIALNPGNSGGPVFDKKGDVIGMVAWGYADKQNLNFAIPVAALRDAVARNPYGSAGPAGDETDRVRQRVEEFWSHLEGGDRKGIRSFLPDYLYERDTDEFKRLVLMTKATIDEYLPTLGRERLLLFLGRDSIEAMTLCQKVMDIDRDFVEKPMTGEEILEFYVDLQRAIWIEYGYQTVEVGEVTVVGAMARFEATVTVKDPATGRTHKTSDTRFCIRDQGEWRYFLDPIDEETLFPR